MCEASSRISWFMSHPLSTNQRTKGLPDFLYGNTLAFADDLEQLFLRDKAVLRHAMMILAKSHEVDRQVRTALAPADYVVTFKALDTSTEFTMILAGVINCRLRTDATRFRMG